MDWNNLKLHEKIKLKGLTYNKKYPDYLNKIKAKNIVQNIDSSIKVAKIIKVFNNENEITEKDINENHILKASRGSGLLLDLGKENNLLNIRKKITDWKLELSKMKLNHEFLIEEKIEDSLLGKNKLAIDYKFFCFHGKPEFFLCRNGNNRNFFYLDYTPIKITGEKLPQIDLTKMIDIATKLSKLFPFVRIDLYNGYDGVYFGEYTFHVNAGMKEFNDDLEIKFGSYWKE
jgi:hypothetical protein